MGLIEGLGDAVRDEYGRLRAELRIAISESDYTLAQVAALAGVGERTLRNILSGAHAVQIDTLLRVAFVVGARIEIARPGEEGARPFQVVPTDPSSSGVLDSSKSSPSRRDQAHGRGSAASKKARKQGGKRPAPKRDTRGWGDLAA